MFVKTYNQFMGHGEEKYEEYKKNFIIKFTFFHMIIMDTIYYHIEFLETFLFLAQEQRGLDICAEIRYIF